MSDNKKSSDVDRDWHDDGSGLGPPDGARFRQMFPTSTPGKAVPFSEDGCTLEELDEEWKAAIAVAITARNARKDTEKDNG